MHSALVKSAIIWLAVTVFAAVMGGALSVLTGNAKDLPVWNGIGYFLFCAKEGAMFGQFLAIPACLIGFALHRIRSRA
ncbi:MAG: hypothetical protein CMJ58_19950 [Planctomycetaceae bacterium]|nr:hypothetical protein [Planctomycetaceae bacterium]